MARIRGLTSKKIFLYSGHEYNVASILQVLGVYYPHIPPYGSYVTIELYRISNVYGIKVMLSFIISPLPG